MTAGQCTCEMMAYDKMNNYRGLIYIAEYDIEDLEILVDRLEEQGVTQAIEAKWIRTRQLTTHAFPLTFNKDSLPEYIKIPGEAFRTKIYEYIEKHMQCRKCQENGHTAKRWRRNTACVQIVRVWNMILRAARVRWQCAANAEVTTVRTTEYTKKTNINVKPCKR